MHAGHPQVLGVAVRECAARHQGGDHRDAGELGQFGQFVASLAADHAAADVEHRLARACDQRGGFLDLAAVRLGVRLVAGQFHLRRPGEGALTLQHVLGDVDQHRARSAGGGDVKGLGDHPGDVVAIADQEVVLGDRHGHAGDVGFLEGVGADQRPAHLPGDGDHRNGIHLRVGQRGDQVRRTRAGGGHHDPHSAGGMGVTAGGVPGALLVADQHVPNLGGVEQRVIQRQDRATGDAEDQVDVELLQRAHHRFGTAHLLRFYPRGGAVTGAVGAIDRRARRFAACLGGRCAHLVSSISGWARKNPRQRGRLYEGCALVRVARPGRGRARHQRAYLLRAFRRSTYWQRLAFAQVGVNCAQRAMMHP